MSLSEQLKIDFDDQILELCCEVIQQSEVNKFYKSKHGLTNYIFRNSSIMEIVHDEYRVRVQFTDGLNGKRIFLTSSTESHSIMIPDSKSLPVKWEVNREYSIIDQAAMNPTDIFNYTVRDDHFNLNLNTELLFKFIDAVKSN